MKRRIWCRLGILKIPLRAWVIPVEHPEEFAADVNARIAFATESP